MKEHSGGIPDIGHISLSSWDEESYVVPIEQFRFKDTPEDYIEEMVRRGEDISPVFRAIVSQLAREMAAAKFLGALAIFDESKKPVLLLDQIKWGAGLYDGMDGASCGALAKKHGVSKQAFVQGAHRICNQINLGGKTRNMRDDDARKNMSKSNYRKKQHVTLTDKN